MQTYAQCGGGEQEYEISFTSGFFNSENSWEIVPAAGGASVISVACGSFQVTTYSFCLTIGTTYNFNAYDDYGDSWNGSTYTLSFADGPVVSTGMPSNGVFGDNSTNCVGLQLEQTFTFQASLPPNCTPAVVSFTQERDCEDLTFEVTATVTTSAIPVTAPLLVATASVNGVNLPGVGGVMPNIAGATVILGSLPLDQNVLITISVFGFNCPQTQTVFQNSFGCPIPLECGIPLDISYCYSDLDENAFLYQSPAGEPVILFFTGGLIEVCCDDIFIYDGVDNTAPLLYVGNNNGNLTNLGVVANSGSLFFEIDADFSVSCNSGSFINPWTWIVGCGIEIPGCTDPEALNFQPAATEDDGTCLFDGDVCENSIVVESLPYNSSANTNLFGDNYSGANVPPYAPNAIITGSTGTFYLDGDDVVYSFTSATNTFIDVDVTNIASWVGLWAFTGCPFTSTVGSHNDFPATSRQFSALPVSAGQTVYIVISTWPAPQSTSYTLNIQETVFDCPEINGFIGDLCDDGDPESFGATVQEDCTCAGGGPFDGCINGFQFGIINVVCGGPAQQVFGSWTNEYTLVNDLLNGGTYTFSLSIASFFITITDELGTTVLAAGQGSLVYTTPANQNVRFYSNFDSSCTPVGFNSHTRIVSADCSAVIYDCEDLGLNIGDVCNDGDPETIIDIVQEDCTCLGGPFDGCLAGFLWSEQPPVVCGGAPSVLFSFTDYYTTLNVLNGAEYTFALDNPALLITISNSTGTEVLATGQGTLVWNAPTNAEVRFYVHVDAFCTQVFDFFHTRTVTVDCANQILDCPDLQANFGDLCDDGDPESLGDVIQEDCTCLGGPFEGCLAGFLWSEQPPVVCGGAPSVVFSFTDYYTTLNVLNGAEYTFSLDNPALFITISNSAGTEVLATGQGTVVWNATLNAEVRFYVHVDVFCTQVFNFFHTREVTVDCANQILDCPDLQVNFGDLCDDGDPESLGDVIQEDCTCLGGPFEGCLSGFLWSAQPPVVCGGAPSVVFSFTDYYTTLNVLNGAEYTFALGNPELFITISNSAGTEVLATGQGTVVWNSTLNAEVRFYVHVDVFCTQVFNFFHIREVTVDCANQILDCPDLQVNFGDNCNDGIPDNGIDQYNEFCECVGLPFAGCTNGFQFGSATVFCGTTQSVFGVWGNEYSVINGLEIGAEYAFATLDIGANYYITITNLAGTEVLATGQGLVEYTSDAVQNVRFYAHVDGQCSTTSGGATSHTRTITADCTTQIYDCPDLQVNFGDSCNDGIPGNGIDQYNEFCECVGLPFAGCTNGVPFGSATVICGTTQSVFGVWANEYSTINGLEIGAEYAFATLGVGADYYITITNLTGTEVLATGQGSVEYTSDVVQNVRFYAHVDDQCSATSGGATSHTRTITADCSTQIYDCPDLQVNFGDSCDDGDPETFGSIVQEDCTCAGGGPFAGCTTGSLFGTRTISCTDSVQTVFGSFTNEYAVINGIEAGNSYLFSLSNEAYFISVTNTAGTEVYAADQGSINWTATTSGTVYFYSHADAICSSTSGFTTSHTKTVSVNCDTEVPAGCEDATFIAAQPEFVMSEIPVSIAGLQSSGATQCQNAGNPQVDQWFSFTSVTTNMYVRAWGLGDFDAAIEVYDACGGTQLLCQNNEGAGLREIGIITNTTVGETYYLRVYHGGATAPATQVYTVAVAHIPFTQLRAADCGVYDYTPASIIRSDWPINQFLLANWYFEFTELEAPFNVYEVLSPNGSNPQFSLSWFTQAEYGRTYSVRTRARMYQGPNWGDYGSACEIGFSLAGGVTQLIESQALGFYNMCDILEADNVPGAVGYRWRFLDGFETLTHDTPNRFLALQDVEGLNLGQPYSVRVRSYFNGQFSGPGLIRLISMNNFVVETGLDQNINTCGSTYALSTVLSAVNICAADFYTFRFTNISNPDQAPLFYTRDDGNRTILLGWVTDLVPGDTYAVQVLGGSGGLVGTYGYSCNITIAGGDGPGFSPDVATPMSDDAAALIQLYPNPTMGDEVLLVLSNLDNEQQSIIVEVYDMFGKKVHNQNIANNGSEMNAALRFQKSLASGVYMVNVIINDQLAGAQKLVVQ